MKHAMLALLLVGCGSAKREVNTEVPPSQRLKDAAARVEPLLLRCDGLPGKPPCESLERQGDALGMAGYYRMFSADDSLDNAVRASIDENGRPWRSPRHREQRAGDFSRDHVISLAQWALGSGDTEVLTKVVRYAASHDWKVCPLDKCLLTPGLLSVVGDVVVYNAGSRPFGTNIPRTVHEAQAQIEAQSGDRCDLVLDKVLLKAKTGNLSSAYVSAAKACAKKVPLYGEFVEAFVTNSPMTSIQSRLADTLDAWQGPTAGGHWTAEGNGWSLVGLANGLGGASLLPAQN